MGLFLGRVVVGEEYCGQGRKERHRGGGCEEQSRQSVGRSVGMDCKPAIVGEVVHGVGVE